MKCWEWEVQIASEVESAALQAHMLQCSGCRQFAAEIAANREALGTLAVDPDALGVVRNRVMAELRAPRRAQIGWIWPAAVAACLAILCGSLALSRFSIPAPPKPVIALARPPIFPRIMAARPQKNSIHRRRQPMVARARTQPLVIKMLTDDPDVVIIWIADQKGDAL